MGDSNFKQTAVKDCGCLNVWVKKIGAVWLGKMSKSSRGVSLGCDCNCTRKPYEIGHGEKRLDRSTMQMQNTYKTNRATTIHQSKQNQLLQLQDHTSLDAMCEGWFAAWLWVIYRAWTEYLGWEVRWVASSDGLLLGNLLRLLLVDFVGSFLSVLCWIIFSTWSPSHLVAALPEQKQGGNLLYSNWCHIDALLSKNIPTTVETCYKLFCLKAPIMLLF